MCMRKKSEIPENYCHQRLLLFLFLLLFMDCLRLDHFLFHLGPLCLRKRTVSPGVTSQFCKILRTSWMVSWLNRFTFIITRRPVILANSFKAKSLRLSAHFNTGSLVSWSISSKTVNLKKGADKFLNQMRYWSPTSKHLLARQLGVSYLFDIGNDDPHLAIQHWWPPLRRFRFFTARRFRPWQFRQCLWLLKLPLLEQVGPLMTIVLVLALHNLHVAVTIKVHNLLVHNLNVRSTWRLWSWQRRQLQRRNFRRSDLRLRRDAHQYGRMVIVSMNVVNPYWRWLNRSWRWRYYSAFGLRRWHHSGVRRHGNIHIQARLHHMKTSRSQNNVLNVPYWLFKLQP